MYTYVNVHTYTVWLDSNVVAQELHVCKIHMHTYVPRCSTTRLLIMIELIQRQVQACAFQSWLMNDWNECSWLIRAGTHWRRPYIYIYIHDMYKQALNLVQFKSTQRFSSCLQAPNCVILHVCEELLADQHT